MKTLIVRQKLENGAARCWRLRESDSPAPLGSSRLARLSSADPQARGIDGVFELRGESWHWIAMRDASDGPVDIDLSQVDSVQLNGSVLHFERPERATDALIRLDRETSAQAQADSTEWALEIVKLHGRTLSLRVLAPRAPESAAARDARRWAGEELIVLRRPIHVGRTRDLLRRRWDQAMDPESRRGSAIMLVCTLLVGTAILFGPRSHLANSSSTPAAVARVAMQLPPSKIKPLEPMKPAEKEAGAAPAASGAAPGKIAGVMKSLSGGRLSRLLGKVSAQAARSREVVLAVGQKAGQGESGPAMAALGKVDQGQGDWGQAAKGSGVSVSTVGRGGGSATGLGGLTAGATGQGGVGLIEDEGQITGGLDREVIAGVIRAHLGQILYCYERQLSASPDLFGKVAVRFTIGPQGAVESQTIGDTTLKNSSVEGCILTKIASWKFPTPQGGTRVLVTYPFLFKSTN